jgi:phage terminase large subunit GpA-like protein
VQRGRSGERAEDFNLENIPAEVLYTTACVDVQKDRLVAEVLGNTRAGDILMLAHTTLWGFPGRPRDVEGARRIFAAQALRRSTPPTARA